MAPTDEESPATPPTKPKITAEIFALSNIVTVIVGKDQVAYGIHETVLKSRCPFFEKCLSAGMKEELEKTVRLPEERPCAFNVLVQWMYTDRITEEFLLPEHDYITEFVVNGTLTHAYVLADKFCMPELQDTIIERIRSQADSRMMHVDWLKHVWKYTEEGSKLRQSAVDKLHYDLAAKSQRFKDTEGKYSADLEMLLDCFDPVVRALLCKFVDQVNKGRKKYLPDPENPTDCVYHVHKEGGRCPTYK
ncbi:hypothetical protein LTR10_020935 [Elasticomyces elasticus]|uniref:BTB domain-containing protein n=1 Tax=Exophiala sideris TaxID=1016849 RepID=A0ABR0JBM4_9EURO|nr:hypothetical protein LTR10_020935 [Elasticomyces elasticus]KAK5031106.1 hypothetical protein LTS07_004841 [Exophiala sideris]KAK5038828.1 hypothetical protein LTR13_003859 [Exophiala sideris]KAK5060711.1 hypothetical protein LTR69_005310 [Exophiala sideris]KAK5183624.1 hypothetical protein LTR44_003906 [Eurotiomycetes sp. CCFEE 6388]